MGPIAFTKDLEPYLLCHPTIACGGQNANGPLSADPYGYASILPWVNKMMSGEDLTQSTKLAILNVN
jgi:glycine dehydrogenase